MKLRSAAKTKDHGVVAVIGGAIMDLIFETERMPVLDESLDALSLVYKPGGKGSNTAVAMYRGQHKKPKQDANHPRHDANEMDTQSSEDESSEVFVYLNTAVGDDAFGQELKKSLRQNGIDISGIRTLTSYLSGTCAVFVEKFTGNSRDIGYPGANTNWTPRYKDSVECLAGGNRPDLIVTHLENKRETVEQVLDTASRMGIETLLNPSPVSYLLSSVYQHVTHLLVNEKEAAELTGRSEEELTDSNTWKEAAEFFLDKGVRYVVITLGVRGAFYVTAEGHGLVPAVHGVEVKDTTGAGDTFVGNYALEYIRQKRSRKHFDIRKAVERGCRAAALTIEHLGAQESIPWADEVDWESNDSS